MPSDAHLQGSGWFFPRCEGCGRRRWLAPLGFGTDRVGMSFHARCLARRARAETVSRRRPRIAPERCLEADVPLPYRIGAVNDAQTNVSLGIGRTVTVDSEGVVRNASGTPIFRLERAS